MMKLQQKARKRIFSLKNKAWDTKSSAFDSSFSNSYNCFGLTSKALLVSFAILTLFWVQIIVFPSSPRNFSKHSETVSSDTVINEAIYNEYHIGGLRHKKQIPIDNRRSSFTSFLPSIDIDVFELIPTMADAIVIGSGLAGMTAALTILDRGGTVIIFEKESILGGNSNKASSGINACCLPQDIVQTHNNDTLELFRQDTVQSAGIVANIELINTLVGKSADAIQWLHDRAGIDLSVLTQLGGHSRKRTHRPEKGFVGAEIMTAMELAIRAYESTGKVAIYEDTQVQRIISADDGQVLGVVSESRYGEYRKTRSDHVVLATGGFASDRSHGSLLEKYRPDLMHMAATAGSFSTGDGIAMAEVIGATTRDMEKIQLHPSGFVDPSDPTNPNKILAAEMLRGAGGILVNHAGERFCNELGTRSYIADKMLHHNHWFPFSNFGKSYSEVPTFYLILSETAAEEANQHVATYLNKGLLKRADGIDNLARFMKVNLSKLRENLHEYQNAASKGIDKFGKVTFKNLPAQNLDMETFYVGEVTPVLHYCMGGVSIDSDGNVMRDDGTLIKGLYGVGEVTGGVHGNNRLGGNSLLECAVFGGIVGRKIPINASAFSAQHDATESDKWPGKVVRVIPLEELFQHDSPDNCWISIQGNVYDLTSFAEQHPGGAKSIHSLAGRDGTTMFKSLHSDHILQRLQHYIIGVLEIVEDSLQENNASEAKLQAISWEELQQHSRPNDCWVALHGIVYDLSEFQNFHPGGSYLIQKLAGKDGTDSFKVFHPEDKLKTVHQYAVGRLENKSVSIS